MRGSFVASIACIFIFVLCILTRIVADKAPNSKLKVTVAGCKSKLDRLLLKNIIGYDAGAIGDEDVTATLQLAQPQVQLDLHFIDDDTDLAQRTESDISLCFLNRGVLMDQNKAISRIYQSLARFERISANTTDTNSDENQDKDATTNTTQSIAIEKPIFLVYEGSSADHAMLNSLASTSLRVEQALLPAASSKTGNVLVAPRLLMLPVSSIQIDEELLSSFHRAFLSHVNSVVSMAAANQLPTNSAISKGSTKPATKSAVSSKKTHSVQGLQGIESVDSALQATSLQLRSLLTNEQRRLNKLTASSDFASFLGDLLQRCEQQLLTQRLSGAAGNVLKLAQQQWRHNAATDLKALFGDKLDRLTQQTLTSFNEAVSHDIEVSATIMQELQALRDRQTKRFVQLAEASMPTICVSHWRDTLNTAVSRLHRVFEDYLQSRKQSLQAQLLLPRSDRIPVDLSLHWFLLHPLGHDHRQNPLGQLLDDQLHFDAGLQTAQSLSNSYTDSQQSMSKKNSALPLFCDAVTARRVLHNQHLAQTQAQTHTVLSKLTQMLGIRSKLDQQSEFSREMLMLPLSLKSPAVPLGGGGRGKNANTASRLTINSQQLLETQRMQLGPQQLLLQDASICPQLHEIQLGLQEAAKLQQMMVETNSANANGGNSGSDKIKRGLDEVFNLLPGFRADSYRHPAINYGVNYSSASTA